MYALIKFEKSFDDDLWHKTCVLLTWVHSYVQLSIKATWRIIFIALNIIANMLQGLCLVRWLEIRSLLCTLRRLNNQARVRVDVKSVNRYWGRWNKSITCLVWHLFERILMIQGPSLSSRPLRANTGKLYAASSYSTAMSVTTAKFMLTFIYCFKSTVSPFILG